MHAPFKLRQLLSHILLVGFTVGFGFAHANDEVARLLKARQLPEALAKADQLLASKPRDPQLRFMKGVIQNEMGRISEATSTFTRLTEDHPELPEPYNNLAVIYANAGQFDKSRAALEMAIRTNPSYSTAHENLGDIYAKLASQSYAKALQLDNSNAAAVQPKLALIRDLFTATPGKASPAGALPTSSVPATSVPAAPVPAPVPAPVIAPPAQPSTPVVAAIQPKVPTVVTSSPSGTNQPSVAPPVVANAVAGSDVEAAVQEWAQAWSNRDMKGYLGSYTRDFAPADKGSHAAWAEERKSRIMGKTRISVKLSSITTNVKGNTATVTFRQDYKADSLATNSRKTLELVKSGDRWLITKEVTG
jgi:tetratricopeptide (TPR) repeat protein